MNKSDIDFDIDGDGKVSPREIKICQLCLLGALAIAFGDKVLAGN